jgi:hypothetical protein
MILNRLTTLEEVNAGLRESNAELRESNVELQERLKAVEKSNEKLEVTLQTTMEAVLGVSTIIGCRYILLANLFNL